MGRLPQNPFRYGAKVTGGAFYDRREIKASMRNVLAGCNNVVLYGPRRYGKSSLVAELMEELRTQGVACVYLNMMNLASLADFIMAYTKAVYAELAPAASALQHVAGFFRRIRPVIGMSDDGKPEMTFSFSAGTVGVAELREAFELPEKLRKPDKPLVIVIDEFQEVAEFGLGNRFEQIMRSGSWRAPLRGNPSRPLPTTTAPGISCRARPRSARPCVVSSPIPASTWSTAATAISTPSSPIT